MATLPEWRAPGRLAGILLLALTLACGGASTLPPEGDLQVSNAGTLALEHLFVAPSGSSSWGVDQLAPEVLEPGEALTLTGLDPGSYDVQARFSDASWDEAYGVPIQDGETTAIDMMESGNGEVDVVNNSASAIDGIFLMPDGAGDWGPDQADQPLPAGQTLALTGVAPGSYDLRVVFPDGSPVDTDNIAVTAGAVTPVPVN